MDEAKPFKQRSNIGSRVTRERHARFWERPEVKFVRATRRKRLPSPQGGCERSRGPASRAAMRLHRQQSAAGAAVVAPAAAQVAGLPRVIVSILIPKAMAGPRMSDRTGGKDAVDVAADARFVTAPSVWLAAIQ